MVGMRVSLGTVVMVGMVDDGRRVGVARKVAIYIVPYRPDPNRPDPTNVDSDPAAPIQPTPASAYFWPCQSQDRYDMTARKWKNTEVLLNTSFHFLFRSLLELNGIELGRRTVTNKGVAKRRMSLPR